MITRRIGLSVVLMILTSNASPARLSAECISLSRSDPVRAAFQAADVVLWGTVESVGSTPSKRCSDCRDLVVRFRNVETFKGRRASAQSLIFSSTYESISFKVGRRVLLYARTEEHGLSTSCSRTSEIEPADEEIMQLRHLTRRQGLSHAMKHRP